ncbi:capsid protein [Cyclopterus lumpus toti-like virus]|nr:capsid protein [Cyclopterus lumpus toti-like virus]
MDANKETQITEEKVREEVTLQVEVREGDTGLLQDPTSKEALTKLITDLAKKQREVVSDATDFGLDIATTLQSRQSNSQFHVLREGNVDTRIASERGSTTHTRRLATIGNVEPCWFRTAPGVRGGILIEPSNAVLALKPLFQGADPGPLSSSARLDINNYSSQTALGFMNSIGADIESNRVSFSEPLIRAFIFSIDDHIRGESPLSWLGNRTTLLPRPLGTLPSGDYFPASVRSAGWVAGDTQAMIVNAEDFAREARGEERFNDGWGATVWNVPGVEGVAVVPIKLADQGDPAINSIWMLMHMENPIRARFVEVDEVDMLLDDPQVGSEWTNLSTSVVPGPSKKVLFVITDMNNNQSGDILLDDFNGAVDNIDQAANVIGGVPVDIGALIPAWMGLDPDRRSELGVAGVRRWTRYYGNTQDWEASLAIVSEMLVTFPGQVQRSGRTGAENHYADAGGGIAQYPLNGIDVVLYDGLTAAEKLALAGRESDIMTTPASGYRQRSNNPNTSPPMLLYCRFSSEAAVAVSALLYKPRFTMTIGNELRPAILADNIYRRGKRTAVMVDIIAGQIGAVSRMTNTPGNSEQPAVAQAIVRQLAGCATRLHQETCAGELVNITVSGWNNQQGQIAWRNLYTDGRDRTLSCRVPRMEYNSLGFDGRMEIDDLYNFKTEGFDALDIDGQQWDHMNWKTPHQKEDGQVTARRLTSAAGWTRALVPLDNIGLVRANGAEFAPLGVHVLNPTVGRGKEVRYSNYGFVPLASEIRELPLVTQVPSQNDANHIIHPAVRGGRPLVLGNMGMFNPIFMDRTPGQRASQNPTTDTQTVNNATVLDF